MSVEVNNNELMDTVGEIFALTAQFEAILDKIKLQLDNLSGFDPQELWCYLTDSESIQGATLCAKGLQTFMQRVNVKIKLAEAKLFLHPMPFCYIDFLRKCLPKKSRITDREASKIIRGGQQNEYNKEIFEPSEEVLFLFIQLVQTEIEFQTRLLMKLSRVGIVDPFQLLIMTKCGKATDEASSKKRNKEGIDESTMISLITRNKRASHPTSNDLDSIYRRWNADNDGLIGARELKFMLTQVCSIDKLRPLKYSEDDDQVGNRQQYNSRQSITPYQQQQSWYSPPKKTQLNSAIRSTSCKKREHRVSFDNLPHENNYIEQPTQRSQNTIQTFTESPSQKKSKSNQGILQGFFIAPNHDSNQKLFDNIIPCSRLNTSMHPAKNKSQSNSKNACQGHYKNRMESRITPIKVRRPVSSKKLKKHVKLTKYEEIYDQMVQDNSELDFSKFEPAEQNMPETQRKFMNDMFKKAMFEKVQDKQKAENHDPDCSRPVCTGNLAQEYQRRQGYKHQQNQKLRAPPSQSYDHMVQNQKIDTTLASYLMQIIQIEQNLESLKQTIALRPDFNIDVCYSIFDVCLYGFVSRDQIVRVYSMLQLYPQVTEVSSLIRRYDLDKTGVIQPNEFIEVFAPRDRKYRDLLMQRYGPACLGYLDFCMFSCETNILFKKLMDMLITTENGIRRIKKALIGPGTFDVRGSYLQIIGSDRIGQENTKEEGFTLDQLQSYMADQGHFANINQLQWLMQRLNAKDGKVTLSLWEHFFDPMH